MQSADIALKGIELDTLLSRIAGGDRNAETELVNTYYRGLLLIINRRANNLSLSEDIVHETLIVVIKKARDNAIQNPHALPSFIRQTGINLLIGHYRKESRRDTHYVDDIDAHPSEEDADVIDALHSEQSMKLTVQLIEELNVERDRVILRDAYVYGKSKEQICNELTLPPEHYDRVLFRARQRLKQLIQHRFTPGAFKGISLIGIFLFSALLMFNVEKDNYAAKEVRDSVNKQHSIGKMSKSHDVVKNTLDGLKAKATSDSRYV